MNGLPPQTNARQLFDGLVTAGDIIDLSHELVAGVPVYPNHPQFSLLLQRRHGDPHPKPRIAGSSYANEVFTMSAHTATHVDAIGHFSRCGLVHGGEEARSIETPQGLTHLDAKEIGLIWNAAELFDIAGYRGVDTLQPGEEVTVADLEACAAKFHVGMEPGDIALLRTGWSRHWNENPDTFSGVHGGLPGPGRDGTRWLLEHGAAMVGSDTPAFEVIPSVGDSVHAMLLVDRGIHIIENLNLEALAARRPSRFLFIGLPLRLVGATGSPFRPIAVM